MTLQLQELMATTATGWAAVIDGVLNINTASHTKNAAALNALCVSGYLIASNCNDPDCDCKVNLLGRLMPAAKLVQITVKVDEAEKEAGK